MKRKPITQVFEEQEDRLLSIPGVQGFFETINDSGDAVIVIMVDSLSAKNKKMIPDSLEGYPVKIEETGVIRPLNNETPSPGE